MVLFSLLGCNFGHFNMGVYGSGLGFGGSFEKSFLAVLNWLYLSALEVPTLSR